MSPAPTRPTSHTPSPLLPTLTALGEVPSPGPKSDGEVEADQLAFTIDSPSRPQLQLFETVFNTGKPLSGYCQDNPLWLLLAEVASPCTNCWKTPSKCKVLPNSPQCTNCSAKKTCSLGKILRYRYFARQCNQDLAYSRRFLELHGTPAHQSTWGIPLSVWCEYDAALHACTSSTSILLELNMLDERDTINADQQELQRFLALQQSETVVAAKRKRDRSPMSVAGPSSKKVRLEVPKKHSHQKSRVVDLGRPAVASFALRVSPRASPSLMEVSNRDLPMQGPNDLVRLAAVAEVHSGLVRQSTSSPAARTPIKGAESDSLFSNMPPTPHSTLVPRSLTAHPYRVKNQRLLDQVRTLESQLADSQRENSSLTTALRDTSHALEAHQREVKQLRTSRQEVLQHEVEYRTVLDQFRMLDKSLSGLPGQTVLQHFQALVEELHVAKRDRDVAVRKLSPASHKSSELTTALLQEQGLVDEMNALASRQRRRLEELQEEVHCTRDRAAFGDLKKAHEDIRHVATFAHRLYRSDPATVLHHHSRYIGAIIEAIIAFLRRGLDSSDPDVVAHNFQLALDYMQTARGIHVDLYMCPPEGSLEPPLHCRMLALSTAFPHCDGAGRWVDIVPAIPSLDQATIAWEQLMLDYIHHITDTPLSIPVPSGEASSTIGESESPTSPSPPPPSPSLPPLFGSVANLVIDLTGGDGDLYEPEESHCARASEVDGVEVAPLSDIPKEEPL
ncbi:hypothetical protein F5879DRAFT_995587 [Lentinula edodes]|nr:hypothetical protein F5879DRAFT_995587 [Lentinula edodes]